MASHPIRALVVDDEPIARQVLREELIEVPDVEVVSEAASGAEALRQIQQLSPDLVFLDLQMPEGGGFEVVRNLSGGPLPVIVIVTAFDQHAIQAFDAGAVDYLLKPVSQERLQLCLERVRQLRRSGAAVAQSMVRLQDAAQAPQEGAKLRRIVGRIGEEYHLLEVSQVLGFQAERELVWILTRRQRYLAAQPLKTLQEKLRDVGFARVHRNALVNLDLVSKMAPLSSQRWLLTLQNQQEFIVSKRQARVIQRILTGGA